MVSDDEWESFEPKVAETEEQKVERMFGSIDFEKKSAYDGKAFDGKEANLRSEYEKKEANEHPYFSWRDKGVFDKKDSRFTNQATEAGESANWQGEEASWFKKMFSKKDARDSRKVFDREAYRLPENTRDREQRSHYEGRSYWTEILKEPNQNKKLSVEDVRDLLNTY